MEFFDNKEEVMDVQLTQHGKRALAMGKFKPTTYAFFDDDILYDIKYSASSSVGNEVTVVADVSGGFGDSTQRGHIQERQNLTSERIKETPRIKTQFNFTGVESQVAGNFSTDCGPGQATVKINPEFTPQYWVNPAASEKLLRREVLLATLEEDSLKEFAEHTIERLRDRWAFIKEQIEMQAGSDKHIYRVVKKGTVVHPSIPGGSEQWTFYSDYYQTEPEALNASRVYTLATVSAAWFDSSPTKVLFSELHQSYGLPPFISTSDSIETLGIDGIIEELETEGIENIGRAKYEEDVLIDKHGDGIMHEDTIVTWSDVRFTQADDEFWDHLQHHAYNYGSTRMGFVTRMKKEMKAYFGDEFFEDMDALYRTGTYTEHGKTLEEITTEKREAIMQETAILDSDTDPKFMTSLFGSLKEGTTFDTALEEQHQGVSEGGVFSIIGTIDKIINESGVNNSNSNIYDEGFSPTLYACSPQSITEKKYSLSAPLGNSSLTTTHAPAWSVKFANGKLLSDFPYTSKAHLTGAYFSTLKVPQLETKILFETFVTKLNADGTYKKNYTEKEDKLNFFGSLEPPMFEEDNTVIQIKPDYLLLDIEEKNTDFIRENFDIEVFHIETQKAGQLDEVINEKQLYFFDPENEEEITDSHVEYYFDLLVDEEISSKYYCYADNIDKKNNILSDQGVIFDCEDHEEKQDNIYKIKIKKEDFEEPC